MPEYIINGIPVMFPFEPYSVQRAYMEKVIECLNNSTNGVLESPTGTGKTLSLLCSALGWVQTQKQQLQEHYENQMAKMEAFNNANGIDVKDLPHRKQLFDSMVESLNNGNSNTANAMGVPRVIYASRTHSQISQAMSELKRTAYSTVKAAVIGSRDQLCIHPELEKESNANKIQLCKIKINTRTCHFHNRLDTQKENPEFRNARVLDIEDLVKIGKKLKCCPYYASKELMSDAEIVFMPYNYLLDPKMRKANKLDLQNTIIILDEAHNVEKMCEESASVQVTSTEIALAIDDVTHILTPMVNNDGSIAGAPQSLDNDEAPDFTVDDLTFLKETFLTLEKAVDDISIPNPVSNEGTTFPGGYIFELLEKANVKKENSQAIITMLDTLIQYLATAAESSGSIFRRGGGLQKMQELLTIVFSSSDENFYERVSRCYKVHVEYEPQKEKRFSKANDNGWIATKNVTKTKSTAKLISYWCFSPGFGMQHLLGKNVRSIILTSGTLAPLKPLISELDIPISVRLENPHIVNSSQVYVKIISHGSNKVTLNSNYQNRDNIEYIKSLGWTINSLCPVIPHGLLIFFPSYAALNKCRAAWQENGIWSSIERVKTIYVEPQTKDAFNNTMEEYYAKIQEPKSRGAIFMAVCRGKVSEGLDFADMNGRAVIITGLPYPPFKDPKIVLKKKYLNENRTRQNEMLSGDDWYFLEASRAVNQAIGRVIRHKNDYGAILLCDTRFNNPRQKSQLSGWIQGHFKNSNPNQTFGATIGELSRFFKNAERTLPQPGLKPLASEDCEVIDSLKCDTSSSSSAGKYKLSEKLLKNSQSTSLSNLPNSNEAFSWDIYKAPTGYNAPKDKPTDLFSGLSKDVKTIDFNSTSSSSSSLVTIHKRNRTLDENGHSQVNALDSSIIDLTAYEAPKKKKYKIVPNNSITSVSTYEYSCSPVTSTSTGSATKSPPAHYENTELPKDRKELLLFVKNAISQEKYKKYLNTFLTYNGDNNYGTFRDNLFEIFGEKRFFYILRGMVRFAKHTHRSAFERDVNQFIASHQ